MQANWQVEGSPSASRSEHRGRNGDASCPSFCWQTFTEHFLVQVPSQVPGHSGNRAEQASLRKRVTRRASLPGI